MKESTWFVGDSLAKISPLLERVLVSQAIGRGCGVRCRELLACWDPKSSWWKTPQALLDETWTGYSGISTRSGIMQNGKLYQRPPQVRPTYENDYILLPTPTKSMAIRGWGMSLSGRRRYTQKVENNARVFGMRPRWELIAWLMGFEVDYIKKPWALWETRLSRK